MPQGFGISGRYPLPKALAAISGIDPRKDTTPKGLTAAADAALRALAAADGHKISSGGGSGGGVPLPLIAAAVMVVAGIGGGALILRGNNKPRRPTSGER